MTQTVTKTILVVEDEPAFQRPLREKLEAEGFLVIGANDGERGLALALEQHPDLILLDLLMPKMDGMTMFEKLRAEGEWGKTVPVFILTSLPGDDDGRNRRVAELEPTYYLEKGTTTLIDLMDKIRERLSPSGGRGETDGAILGTY